MLIEFSINGTKYYFYPSHYVIYDNKTYERMPYGEPGKPKMCLYLNIKTGEKVCFVVFKANSNQLLLSPDGIFYFRKSGVGTPQPTGYKVDVTSIANQGQLKLYRTPEAEIPFFSPEATSRNGGNGGNGDNGENGLFTAGFPIVPVLIAVVLLGIGATLFVKTKKKGS